MTDRERLQLQRERRELLFWTARQTLLIIVLATLVCSLILSLVKGHPVSDPLLRLLR